MRIYAERFQQFGTNGASVQWLTPVCLEVLAQRLH